jgi:uncharacterized membrane-anchored protein
MAAKVAQLRAALLDAIKPEDMRLVAQALVEQAKAGDIASVRELLSRALGRPLEADILERIEKLEQLLEKAGQE